MLFLVRLRWFYSSLIYSSMLWWRRISNYEKVKRMTWYILREMKAISDFRSFLLVIIFNGIIALTLIENGFVNASDRNTVTGYTSEVWNPENVRNHQNEGYYLKLQTRVELSWTTVLRHMSTQTSIFCPIGNTNVKVKCCGCTKCLVNNNRSVVD